MVRNFISSVVIWCVLLSVVFLLGALLSVLFLYGG